MSKKKVLTIELLHQIERENTVELTDFFAILETVDDLLVMRRVLDKAKKLIEEGYSPFLCNALQNVGQIGTADEKTLSYTLIDKISSSFGHNYGTLGDWIDGETGYKPIRERDTRREYRLAWLRWMNKQLDLLEDQYRGTQVRPYGG